MTLEEYIAHLNALSFWKEFTFAGSKFAPQPGNELELADNLVWLGDKAFILQLKQRGGETNDPQVERSWFQKKVIKKATSQVRDTLRFLHEHKHIQITNERGHAFDLQCGELAEITKIIVFLGGRALPDECRRTRYHLSRTAGFIHVLEAHDYLGVLEKLRVPEDIRRYFAYREHVTQQLQNTGLVVDEPDIMGAFLTEEDLPSPKSRETLRRFVQDFEEFDLSWLIGDLHNHIDRSEQPYDYYSIMLEFARIPRSVWREVKLRLVKSLEAVREGEFTRPFRLTYPATDCTFMIAPLDPQIPATGPAGERARVIGLMNLTYGAKYSAKSAKCIGILVSRDREFVQIDWCLRAEHWEPDSKIEAWLSEANPFRETKEKMMSSFFFASANHHL